MSANDYSADAFYKFFSYAVERGLYNKNTGEARKTAAKRVLGALKSDELNDLRTLDRDMAFTRFQNLNASEFSPSSLSTYRSRFEGGLDDFIRWAENPAGFKPSVGLKPPRSAGQKTPSERPSRESHRQNPKRKVHEVFEDDTQYAFPIPIRDGKVVVKILNLPTDLSPDEAKRIGGVIVALAVHAEHK